jgi:hypothetical protein
MLAGHLECWIKRVAMRVLTFAAMLLLCAAPAWADEPIATTSSAQASAPQPSAVPPPLPSRQGAPAGVQPVAMGPCGPEKIKPNGELETAPHGEVTAGVGNHGYRELGGTICQPIGQNGAVSVSIDQTQGNWGRR